MLNMKLNMHGVMVDGMGRIPQPHIPPRIMYVGDVCVVAQVGDVCSVHAPNTVPYVSACTLQDG